MATVTVNMDLCYSDTLAEFQGCFFNYQMNRYLSRGISPEEYLKIFSMVDPAEIDTNLQRRHQYSLPQQALTQYQNFCKEAYITEKSIRDFFMMCLNYLHWCITDGANQESSANYPFTVDLVREILEDITRIVYKNDTENIRKVMDEARVLLQEDYEPGLAYLQVQGLMLKVIDDWDVEHPFVGDDHGARLRNIFCAASIGNQKSANVALARGFNSYRLTLEETEQYPIHEQSGAPKKRSGFLVFPEPNSYVWFVTNPYQVNNLESTFINRCTIIKVGSSGDFFQQFQYSEPWKARHSVQGTERDQRISILVALASGKNLKARNPNIDLIKAAGPDDVTPFSVPIADWVEEFIHRGFGNDVDWIGKTFREGANRPGLYIDSQTLHEIQQDERSIGVADVALTGDTGGQPPPLFFPDREPAPAEPETPGRKRKRSRVDTGERGRTPSTPISTKRVEDVDPEKESSNSLLMYGIVGVGTFLLVIFAGRS